MHTHRHTLPPCTYHPMVPVACEPGFSGLGRKCFLIVWVWRRKVSLLPLFPFIALPQIGTCWGVIRAVLIWTAKSWLQWEEKQEMFSFRCQQMTDLNRKPYTIQMIQNDITLGKEAGSRETLQSDSFSADIFYRNDQIHKLTMPSAESWFVFQVNHENLSIHQEFRDLRKGQEHLTFLWAPHSGEKVGTV